MTRPYLLLVRSSSSSIGGLVMPSGAGATPDTGGRAPHSIAGGSGRRDRRRHSSSGALLPWREAGRGRSQQSYQFIGGPGDVVVDDHHVEPPGGVELGLRGAEPAFLDRRRFRPPARQPADQRGPRGGCQEDELGIL